MHTSDAPATLRAQQSETFLDAYRRLGAAPFKEALYGGEVKAA